MKKGRANSLKGQLAQLGGCSLDEHNRIVLDESFCEGFLDHVKGVLGDLIDALSKRLDQG